MKDEVRGEEVRTGKRRVRGKHDLTSRFQKR